MRKKQKSPQKLTKKYRKYNKEALLNAYKAVKENGIPVLRAAMQFNVPEQTLRDRVKGKIDANNLKLGAENLFSEEEELSLVEHIETMAQLGYGLTNTKLQYLAGELAASLKRRTSNKPLSNCWLYGFLNGWKHRLTSLKPRGLESSRAKSSTPEIVQNYFESLSKIMDKYQLTDKPQFIFNIDETGIQPEHRPPNVIAPVGSKPQSVTSPRSTTTTVIACANATGHHIPPFFVFKGKRFNPELMKGASLGSQGVMSDSGWSNADIFQQYLKNHFLPNKARGADIRQHILVIFDGHASHVSRQLIDWAVSNNLILFVLPAHTSHILQPLDVSIFGPFKSFYYRGCASFMQSSIGKTVTRYDMCHIACRAYLRAMASVNIMSGFRKTGIFPFSKEAVEEDKLYPSESFREDSPVQKITAIKSGKEAVQQFLLMKSEKPQPICCKCKCSMLSAVKPVTQKPKPGGSAITENEYATLLDNHNKNRHQITASNAPSCLTTSPKPSTSGLNIISDMDANNSSSSDDGSFDDTDFCCVCNKFSPPDLNKKPYLKIVNWAKCDNCGHWVHLSFCVKQSVVRRNDVFLCPHCSV